jgi:uncharacterized Zn-finger protein
MIRLEKLEKPTVLADNAAAWTQEYVDAKANRTVTDTIRYRYRHPEVKTRIREETSEKCAYCESKITHTYPGDIEHILPVSDFPQLICEWINLTLACGECNRRKGNYHSVEDPLIQPYTDNPDAHLFAFGAIILARLGDAKGAFAELKLGLNRAELLERRSERAKSLNHLANRFAIEPNVELKALLRTELLKEMERDKEYAMVARALVQACGYDFTTSSSICR